MATPAEKLAESLKVLQEMASVQQNIAPFAKFIGDLVKLTMDRKPVAEL